MKIAFIGTRGVPASYSGFETFVEELGARLTDRGHEVTVYCRRHHVRQRLKEYRGMNLVQVAGIATKHLDTISHTLIACLHSLFGHYDIVVMCISGNSPLTIIPRLAGAQVVLNVDGSDWRRKKWGRLARVYIRLSEWLAVRAPNVTVTDSRVMQDYYRRRFGADTECIGYGSELAEPRSDDVLDRLGLDSRGYLLFVGRLVPENCPDHLVDAFQKLDTPLRCVVVGDAPYAVQYISTLKRRGRNILFPGYIFGDGYRQLLRHAFAVVVCSEVGGTHPVLIEAMAAGNCVIVNGTAANREVIGDAGIPYDGTRGAEALAEVLQPLLDDDEQVARYRSLGRDRAVSAFSWQTVTDQYEALFRRLTGTGPATLPGLSSELADSR